MTPEVDPSTLTLTPHNLSKVSKKDLTKHLSALQAMYEERGKKYEKAKSIIRKNKSTTQAKSVNIGLIPKPHGRRSRDFSIYAEMQVEGKAVVTRSTYKNLINSVHLAVESSNFNMGLPLKEQETTELAKVIAYIKGEYPFVSKYHNTWPVIMLIRQFMDNHRNHRRVLAKTAQDDEPDLQEPAPAAATTTAGLDTNENGSGNEGEGEGEDEDDVNISDVEDD